MVKGELLEEVVDELLKYQFEIIIKIASFFQLQKVLSEQINFLITNNFSSLIAVLYRLDISEKKLRMLLANNADKNAGDIIADLIIERQLQKIELRKTFKVENDQISEDERW